jgi:heptaprenyl diphosphate synthase
MEARKSMMSATDRRVSYYASAALVLSLLEYMIPKPIPFLKMGLANLPLLLALDLFPFSSYFMLALLKTVGSGLISGTLFSQIFLITAGGGLASALVMWAGKKVLKGHISLLGNSVNGALASNAVQLLLADKLVYGETIRVVSPLLFTIGLAGGIMTGILAQMCKKHGILESVIPDEPTLGKKETHTVLFILLSVIIVLLFFVRSIPVLLLCWMFLLLSEHFSGRHIRIAPSIAIIISFLFLSLFQSEGTVLWSWRSIALTDGGVRNACVKGIRLAALVTASQTMVVFPPSLSGRFFLMLQETLGYFSAYRLSREGGTLIEKIQKTLESPLKGRTQWQKRAMKTTATGSFVICALLCLVFSVTIQLFSCITNS